MRNKPAARRTIIIGDVHGCSAELRDLLRATRAAAGDRLISVGDLLCKGPDSRGVLEWAMRAPNLECVLGNHELRFLNCRRRGVLPDVKPYDLETVRQLDELYEPAMRFVSSWPLMIDELDLLVVHAGFDPRRALARQSDVALTGLRRLKDTGEPWYERYEDERLVVFGHWARPQPVVRPNACGLDTGCVYGGALTALILPERRLVSVPARRVYARKESWPPRALEAA